MQFRLKQRLLCWGAVLLYAPLATALWDTPLRGTWVALENGAFVIAGNQRIASIVVAPNAHSAVRRAAEFLASDIEAITGKRPQLVDEQRPGANSIRLATVGQDTLPQHMAQVADALRGRWEAHRILTLGDTLWLIGSNPRGTAFASYTLSERIGIDPLHHWSGYEPAHRTTLAVRPIDYTADEPTFRYRGLFHDDEDTLPRPLDANGYPQYAGGAVPHEWYARYFETALRLRMNQVAPFVRTLRPFEVAQMASDWGLFYTSHHYDILLSNPFGFERFKLAEQRGVSGDYNWTTNAQGLMRYWRAGVEEHKALDVIWPVGLRGRADTAYLFPDGTTQAEKNRVFAKAIRDQVASTKQLLAPDKRPVFHFTLYGEMLDNYQAGSFDLPEDVILVWNDTGDGIMRLLPETLGRWQHGIYYHLAYYGATTKQTHHTIRPDRIEQQFRNIVRSGATEYLLLNVSEVREFVMNTRMIADIAWDATSAFAAPDAARRYVDWWAREYFGAATAPLVRDAYTAYFDILHSHDQIMWGAGQVDAALSKLAFRLNGDHHVHYTLDDLARLETLQERLAKYGAAFELIDEAKALLADQEQRFLFENLELGLSMDYHPTKAASLLNRALRQYPDEVALQYARRALTVLERLESQLAEAERAPFEGWYANTWIRRHNSRTSPHYAFARLKHYLDTYQPRYK